jgi:hypothetical protein
MFVQLSTRFREDTLFMTVRNNATLRLEQPMSGRIQPTNGRRIDPNNNIQSRSTQQNQQTLDINNLPPDLQAALAQLAGTPLGKLLQSLGVPIPEKADNSRQGGISGVGTSNRTQGTIAPRSTGTNALGLEDALGSNIPRSSTWDQTKGQTTTNIPAELSGLGMTGTFTGGTFDTVGQRDPETSAAMKAMGAEVFGVPDHIADKWRASGTGTYEAAVVSWLKDTPEGQAFAKTHTVDVFSDPEAGDIWQFKPKTA